MLAGLANPNQPGGQQFIFFTLALIASFAGIL
jgi:hypothetical protein